MIRFNLPPLQRFLLFLCISALCLIVGSTIVFMVLHSGLSPAKARIATIIQDLIVFIVPAIVTAIIVTRQPAELLLINSRPTLRIILLASATLIASIPVMNTLISWNASLSLPESAGWLEEWMRQSEAQAAQMVSTIIGGSSIGSLLITLLIVGVLAGFSEEIFFRGTIQRLLVTSGVKAHLAIWSTAFIFSAIHMQFFGFIPRLLLGAYFGYIAYWSHSLWPAIFTHILNNILAATTMWNEARGHTDYITETLGGGETTPGMLINSISIICVILLITVTVRTCRHNKTLNV